MNSLRNGIVVNLLGMGAAILGMQATVGLLVAKALTSSAIPYYQAASPGNSPVLALDVFLVQVCFFPSIVILLENPKDFQMANAVKPKVKKLVELACLKNVWE